MLDIGTIDALCAGRYGEIDVPCPECGPFRQSALNRRRRTLRIWRSEATFASYCCARCDAHGYVRDDARSPDPARTAKVQAEAAAAAEHRRIHKAERLAKALWLWRQRQPIIGSIAEVYLRECRKYSGPLPATLGYLPARGAHAPAMIGAFGLAHEVAPGVLAIADDAVRGVHLTKLALDGSGKAGTAADKIMIGSSSGSPIVVAPPNDLLGLAITEGIEDALSIHQDTGLGVWCAGAANRMPALAEALPSYLDSITVVADDDPNGRRFAADLAGRIRGRKMEVRTIIAGAALGEAA